jgi:hypothetical protein
MLHQTMLRTINRSRLLAVAAVLVLGGGLCAQAPPATPFGCVVTTAASGTISTPSGPGAPPVLQTLNIERMVPLTSLQSTLTPNIPANVQAGVTSGALEVRESLQFNPQNCLLTVTMFTVQPGSPLPTPTTTTTSNFSVFTIKITDILSTTTPSPSFLMVGTVATNTPASPFGNLSGAPAEVSIGYTTDTPPKISNAVVVIAGTVVEFTAAASGTLTFTGAPSTPPGTTGAVKVVIAPVGTAFAPTNITLDASASTGASTPLTYAWTVVAGPASLGSPTAAVTSAFLPFNHTVYIFQVTVKDAAGNTGTGTVSVTAP